MALLGYFLRRQYYKYNHCKWIYACWKHEIQHINICMCSSSNNIYLVPLPPPLLVLIGNDIRLRLNNVLPLPSFVSSFWFSFKEFICPPPLLVVPDEKDGGILIALDEDLEGLNKKDRDLNINFASPSKVVIELLLLLDEFDPWTLFSFEDELVRRPVEEIYSKQYKI